MALRYGCIACLLALAIGLAVSVCPATAQNASTDDVKAAFLFNFTKFVQWPAGAFSSDTSSFVIGILGDDTVGESLREIVRGKTANGRELRLKRVSASDDLEHLQVLFITKSEASRVADLLARLSGKHVLTVADARGFCLSGGMVQLNVDHNQVQFEINLDAAQRSQLGVSSKLLTLAKLVHSVKPAGAR